MSREADVLGFTNAVLTVQPGATLALLVTPVPGQVSTVLKYGAGGSLEIVGAPPPLSNINSPGTTVWAGSSLVTLQGTGYLLGTAEALSWDGSSRFYLIATGATATAYLLRGLSSGY